MTIEILDKAEDDLVEGYLFYEAQQAGLGVYFVQNLYPDIESPRLNAGIYRVVYLDYHRLVSKRFRSQFSTRWPLRLLQCMPWSIADDARRGSGNT
jgi:hypothetical protein